MNLAKPSKNIVLIGLSGATLLIIAFLVYYGYSMWPKQDTQLGKKKETGTSKAKTETVTPVKK